MGRELILDGEPDFDKKINRFQRICGTIIKHLKKTGTDNQMKFYRVVSWMRADSAVSALIRHTVQPFTESDDTRCCDNTICPPEDGHVDVRNMSRNVM